MSNPEELGMAAAVKPCSGIRGKAVDLCVP